MVINFLNNVVFKTKKNGFFIIVLVTLSAINTFGQNTKNINKQSFAREHIKINEDWKFMRYESNPDTLIYDVRPEIVDENESKVADSKPTEAVKVEAKGQVLKNWILPSGNDFINDPASKHQRPKGDPGSEFPFVKGDFNDVTWEEVQLPHDWAIKGSFYLGDNPEVGGGMGRLLSHCKQ